MAKETRSTYIILGLLLLLAAILRLLHPLEIPFTADEFDALARTKFSSFSELINKGVIIDAHPAGVQVFLYYWTKIFGYSELAVKLPFIACGVLAVLYTFLLAKEWFNATAGLVCAAFLATLQHTLMYSQIARPYSSGLFFSLAMVYYWTLLVFSQRDTYGNPETNHRRNIILYVLFSVLCTYNHYFTLLLSAIVGISGLFFIQRKHLVKYMAAGLCIFILYLPHMRIFLYQFHVGGLRGILGPPQNDYIIDYIKYTFNFSRYIYAIAAALFLAGLISFIRRKDKKMIKFILLSFCWFTIQFLIGFLYSKYANPILEKSSLIFTFPFFLFCLFGWLPELKLSGKLLAVLVICIVCTLSLTHERKYYDIFYKSRYEQEVLLTDSVIKKYGINDCLPFLQMNDDDSVPQYYIKKHKIAVPYINQELANSNLLQLTRYLQTTKNNHHYLSFGGLARSSDPVLMAIFLNYYPYLIKQSNFDQGSFFLLTSNPNEGKSPYIFESVNSFEQRCQYWSEANKTFVSDSISFAGKHAYKMDSLNEWGSSFTCPLTTMTDNKHNLILISVSIYPLEKLKDVDIVSVIKSGNREIYWSSNPVSRFISDDSCRTWGKGYHAIKLPD
ncbi:MAG TPA: glycosyltransferase family 39 protein, partial [Bacteroidia bacterium]|nr:glycosyltransferase family 39 protein [Bacteroidia bacterium]